MNNFLVSHKRWLSSETLLMSAKQIRDNTSFILSSLVILHQISRDFMWWCMPWFKDIIFFNGHQPCFNIDYGPNYLIWHSLKSSYSTCLQKGLLCNAPLQEFHYITWFVRNDNLMLCPHQGMTYSTDHSCVIYSSRFTRRCRT